MYLKKVLFLINRPRFLGIVPFLIGLIIPVPAGAEIYKCKTQNGKTVYSQKPCSGKTSEVLKLKKDSHFSNAFSGQARQQDRPVLRKPTVDLYMTSWCPYCKKAIAFLNAEGIEFNQYDIERDLDAAMRKREIDPSYGGVPLTVINGKVIRGFSKERFIRALNL